MRAHEKDDGLVAISSLMLDFLASKSLVASERALRRELHLLLHSKESSRDPPAAWKKIVCDHNVYTSELEKQLNITVPLTTRRECVQKPSINHLHTYSTQLFGSEIAQGRRVLVTGVAGCGTDRSLLLGSVFETLAA